MDTLGGLVDKLNTVSLKMWNAQEDIYAVRKMDFAEFKAKWIDDLAGAERLWEILKKACDINIQRNQLIDEIDTKIVEMIDAKISGANLDDGKFVQRKFKTY